MGKFNKFRAILELVAASDSAYLSLILARSAELRLTLFQFRFGAFRKNKTAPFLRDHNVSLSWLVFSYERSKIRPQEKLRLKVLSLLSINPGRKFF